MIDYLETRNSTQSHGFSLFNNVFVKSNVTLIQKTKKTQTIERKKSLLQVFPSIPSDLIYISRFQLAAEENSTDNFLLVFVSLKILTLEQLMQNFSSSSKSNSNACSHCSVRWFFSSSPCKCVSALS